MGKHYDALRKKCPCQYCQAETANNNWAVEHRPCVTPSPMEAYEAAAEKLAEIAKWPASYPANANIQRIREYCGAVVEPPRDILTEQYYCTREDLHDGPCNGWPMQTCARIARES